MKNLFKKKKFTSHSGIELEWKIECDVLSSEDIKTLAWIISKRFTFAKVIGIKTGGERLAKALTLYEKKDSDCLLLVDDVLTTGSSMQAERRKQKELYGWDNIIGVVIFARGICPNWVTPIFNIDMAFRCASLMGRQNNGRRQQGKV